MKTGLTGDIDIEIKLLPPLYSNALKNSKLDSYLVEFQRHFFISQKQENQPQKRLTIPPTSVPLEKRAPNAILMCSNLCPSIYILGFEFVLMYAVVKVIPKKIGGILNFYHLEGTVEIAYLFLCITKVLTFPKC